MKTKTSNITYFWRVIYAHTIAYFLAGLFAVVVLNYKDLFAAETVSLIMRPVSDPVVALGPFLQIFRGFLIALVLLPLRRTFFEEARGFWKLGLLVLGLSLLSTIGPTMGSFEGYIYTKVPYQYQILGYPEAVLYDALFTGILKLSYAYEKRIVLVLSIMFVTLIAFMSVMGFITGGMVNER
ncbi:MAG: hypothetical protein MdMp014T_2489 [Treponematales bacterium]